MHQDHLEDLPDEAIVLLTLGSLLLGDVGHASRNGGQGVQAEDPDLVAHVVQTFHND